MPLPEQLPRTVGEPVPPPSGCRDYLVVLAVSGAVSYFLPEIIFIASNGAINVRVSYPRDQVAFLSMMTTFVLKSATDSFIASRR